MTSQYDIAQTIRRGWEMPIEIWNQIRAEVVQTMGMNYMYAMEMAVRIAHELPSGEHWFPWEDEHDENQAVHTILSVMRDHGVGVYVPPVHRTNFKFDDDMVDTLGSGFCYLKAFNRDKRVYAFNEFFAYPRVDDLLRKCPENFHGKGLIAPSSFFIGNPVRRNDQIYAHLSTDYNHDMENLIEFYYGCYHCDNTVRTKFYSTGIFKHAEDCKDGRSYVVTENLEDGSIRIGGLFDFVARSSKKNAPKGEIKRTRPLTASKDHEDPQVLNFSKTIKGKSIEPEMSRDLYSVPKPEQIETMNDHLMNHKTGDTFPYLAVVGTEEESKDSRLSRLRALRSPYGKENKPEMRINGIILDELEGTILVQNLKDYVDTKNLNKNQMRQNKKFKPLNETSFTKPYLLISRITGEYVPLMSSTSDYTDLHFTLEDGRLLDNQTIVQSNKLPSNQNGVFELSCDYCLNVKDLSQLSLKYFLARPVMKEDFQWGAVSLTVRLIESDTPFLLPKVEAMAIVRTPYTTLEEHSKDPDHADVVFTSEQVHRFQEMYRTGDIADVDEPKAMKAKKSSYSKSSIRNTVKGESGPSHLGEQEGWEQLKGMRKPLVEEGVASVSVDSLDSGREDVGFVPTISKEEYVRRQEALRAEFSKDEHEKSSEDTFDIPDEEARRSLSPPSIMKKPQSNHDVQGASLLKKSLRFEDEDQRGVDGPPNTKDVYVFN
nr:putative movement protein [Valsa mali negative-strand RNA virus 1]